MRCAIRATCPESAGRYHPVRLRPKARHRWRVPMHRRQNGPPDPFQTEHERHQGSICGPRQADGRHCQSRFDACIQFPQVFSRHSRSFRRAGRSGRYFIGSCPYRSVFARRSVCSCSCARKRRANGRSEGFVILMLRSEPIRTVTVWPRRSTRLDSSVPS